MKLALALFASLALTSATDGAPKQKKYDIDVSKTTTQVKTGTDGLLHLLIQAKKGYKVSPDAPLKIKLAADGLKLHKTKLGHKDAKDAKATSPEFGVRFAAAEAGKRKIDVDATFFVCDANICERKTEKLTVAVNVAP